MVRMCNKKRLEFEIENTFKHYPNFKYKLIRQGKYRFFAWVGEIHVDKKSYYLYIRFGTSFPNVRPTVSLLDNKLEVEKIDTSHKDKYDNLCLYTSDGSGNSWNKNYTIVNVIEKTKVFIEKRLKGQDRDVHKTINNAVIDLTNEKKYVMNFKWFPKKNGESGEIIFENKLDNENFNYAICIKDINDNIIEENVNPYFESISDNVITKKIKWICMKRESIYKILSIKNKKEFYSYIRKKQTLKPMLEDDIDEIIIFMSKEDKLFVKLGEKNEFSNVINIEKGMFFARNRNIIDVEKISNKKVTVFGVGSLGSKITEMLCRSGVENFTIVDYDQFSPENLSRHILTTKDLFLNKAISLKKRILSINPLAKVMSFSFNLFNYDELYLCVKDIISDSDLIICSTGDEESEYFLNDIMSDISKEKKIPCIYSGILGNGFGGRIHKVIIGETPCYKCIKLQQEKQPEIYKLFNENVFLQTNNYKLGIYSEPGIPGLDVDITIFAGIVVKMSLETLLEEKKIFKYNSYIWSNMEGWIFQEPFMLKNIKFSRVENCSSCGGAL